MQHRNPYGEGKASAWAKVPLRRKRQGSPWTRRTSQHRACQRFSSSAHSTPWRQPLSHHGQLGTLESQPNPSWALESWWVRAGHSCCIRGGHARLEGDWEAAGVLCLLAAK